LELGQVEEKKGKEKLNVTRLTWRVDPAKPSQDPVANQLTFVFFIFFTKTTSF
jgi:hypothetical protein